MDILKSRDCDAKMKKLKALARERGLRSDEKYLRRFLVGRNDNVYEALRALENNHIFVNRRQNRWLSFEKPHLEAFFKSQIVDALNSPGLLQQEIVWVRAEKWNPLEFTCDEILKASGLLCELVYQTRKDVNCIDVIMDLHDLSFRHLYALSAGFAKRMVFFMSECLPMKVRRVYIVRQPRIFYLLYAIFKPFLGDRIRRMIYVLGDDFTELIENIGREVLPSEIGGFSLVPPTQRWLKVMKSKAAKEDLELAGYEINTVHDIIQKNHL